jgi:hypothetical protein
MCQLLAKFQGYTYTQIDEFNLRVGSEAFHNEQAG